MELEIKHSIGLIGLGLVGNAIAKRLMTAGHTVVGYDISPEAREKAKTQGIVLADNLEPIAASCRTIVLSLPDEKAVRKVLWNQRGLAYLCPPNTLILDSTTTSPDDTRRHEERLRLKHIRFIDIPLVGSSAEIARGEAVVLVGCLQEDADFAPFLRCFASKLYFLEKPGNAHRMKLIVNLVIGANRLVLAEALALAEHCQFDTLTALDILKHSAAYARVMDSKGERMCRKRFDTPVARLAQHAKDVRLMLRLAKSVNAKTPVSRLHHRLLREAIRMGLGNLDNSAIVSLFYEKS